MHEINLGYNPGFQELAGVNDSNLLNIEKRFNVRIIARGGNLRIRGDKADTELTKKLMVQLFEIYDSGRQINNGAIKFMIHAFHDDPSIRLKEIFSDDVRVSTGKREVAPRSLAQREYVFAMRRFDIVIATGPAGTGKTYLAMACAVNELLQKRVSRIILTRPAVEAGESLGFLPGDLYEKINPYLRPLYDALFDMLEADHVKSLLEQGLIEIAPLAYMRGRTLNDAFIVLDEAQNSTPSQMKMFLTRLGFNSKAVITGDVTQVDLPSRRDSGLIQVNRILKNIPGIRLLEFTDKDVVRHDLVKRIIKAYENSECDSREGLDLASGGERQ